jgi:putative methyltransferase
MNSDIKVAFINPPISTASTASMLTWGYLKTYYNRKGKYPHKIEWIDPPYKFDKYNTVENVYDEISDADIFLFSSYIWNYQINKSIAAYVKKQKPNAITMLGGPQIDVDSEDLINDNHMYDYINVPTSPGELFLLDFLDKYFEQDTLPDPRFIPYEARSSIKLPWEFIDINPYGESFDYFNKLFQYSKDNNLTYYTSFETSRGCPFKCTYCEWGGGTGTKIKTKSIETVKAELDSLRKMGVNYVYYTDANFGAFRERDLDILKYARSLGISVTGISMLKTTNLEKQISLWDAVYDIQDHSASHIRYSLVPSVSIQTVNPEALKIAKRKGLCLEDQLKFAEHLKNKNMKPDIELIRGMPGSTLDDFYEETNIIFTIDPYSQAEVLRFDYMMLPDTEVTREAKENKHGIVTVDVYIDEINIDKEKFISDLYKNNKSYYKTMSYCNSYTQDEGVQMLMMSFVLNYAMRRFYSKDIGLSSKEFSIATWKAIQHINGFQEIYNEFYDILNPKTPPRNIQQILGRDRLLVVTEWIKTNETDIQSWIYAEAFAEIA